MQGDFIDATSGEELAHVVVDHWHISAGSTVFIDELAYAKQVTGVTLDSIASVIDAVDAYRGHDFAVDVLSHALVPSANRRAVCDLLDQIVELCERC